MKRELRTIDQAIQQGSLMSPHEVAQALNVSPLTVKEWAKAGKLPSISISPALLRFDPLEVQAMIDSGRQKGVGDGRA